MTQRLRDPVPAHTVVIPMEVANARCNFPRQPSEQSGPKAWAAIAPDSIARRGLEELRERAGPEQFHHNCTRTVDIRHAEEGTDTRVTKLG